MRPGGVSQCPQQFRSRALQARCPFLNHAAAKLPSIEYRGAPPTTLSKTTGATLCGTRGPATFRYATHTWIIRADTPNILAIR
jgi:hypothetical protein